MKYYLGFIEVNWADELDVEQTVVMTSDDINDLERYREKYDDREVNISIGTNECIEDITAGEIFDKLEYAEISEKTYDELRNTGLMACGLPMIIEDMIKDLKWEDKYEED